MCIEEHWPVIRRCSDGPTRLMHVIMSCSSASLHVLDSDSNPCRLMSGLVSDAQDRVVRSSRYPLLIEPIGRGHACRCMRSRTWSLLRRILKRGRLTQLGRVSEAARPGQRCHSYRFCRTIRARGPLCAFCRPAVARTLYAVLLHCELCTSSDAARPKRLAAYCSKVDGPELDFNVSGTVHPGQLLSPSDQQPALTLGTCSNRVVLSIIVGEIASRTISSTSERGTGTIVSIALIRRDITISD